MLFSSRQFSSIPVLGNVAPLSSIDDKPVPAPAGKLISSNVVVLVFATPSVVAGKPLESKPSVVIGVYGVVVCSAPDVPSTTLPSSVAYTSQLLSVPPAAASSSFTKKYCRICGSPNES